MPLRVDVPVSPITNVLFVPIFSPSQMNSDAPRPEIVDAENAAYDISSKVIEDQDFPYWLPVIAEDGSGLRDKSIG